MDLGDIMMMYTQMVAEETAAKILGEDVVKDRKKFKINLPDGSSMWVTGSNVSEAFLNGWKQLEGKLSRTVSETPCTTSETFKTYAEKWMEMYKKPKVGNKWYYDMCCILENRIYPEIGNKKLDEIKAEDIVQLYNKTSDKSKSLNDKIKIVVNEVLNSAVEDGLIQKNVAASKRIVVNGISHKREALTEDEISNIKANFHKLDSTESLMVSLLFYTGMRKGEVLALNWEDVDLENMVINVTHGSEMIFNQISIKSPKSKAGIRKIPICDELKKEFDKHTTKKGYLFGGEECFTRYRYAALWRTIVEKLEIPNATAHRFRHSFITRMKNILDAKTLQTISGHSNISTTMNIYAHTTDSDIENARKKINESQIL